jgi:hypothetical protein
MARSHASGLSCPRLPLVLSYTDSVCSSSIADIVKLNRKRVYSVCMCDVSTEKLRVSTWEPSC